MRFDKNMLITSSIMTAYFTGVFWVVYNQLYPVSYETKQHFIESYQHSTCEMDIFIPCETPCYYTLSRCNMEFVIIGSKNTCCPEFSSLYILHPFYHYMIEGLNYIHVVLGGIFVVASLISIYTTM